jgi:cell division protein FtsX
VDIALATAQLAQEGSFSELVEDPVLTLAAVFLMVVSVMYVVVARLVTRNMKKAAIRRMRRRGKKPPRPTKEMWNSPP